MNVSLSYDTIFHFTFIASVLYLVKSKTTVTQLKALYNVITRSILDFICIINDFIAPDMWTLNSRDLNPVDYSI